MARLGHVFFLLQCDCHPAGTRASKFQNDTGLLDADSVEEGSWFLL